MAKCVKCGGEIADKGVCISKELSADEYTECWYFCATCGVYTLMSYSEPFFGDETSSVGGPYTKEQGDEKVELIKKCDTPWAKKCSCEAHAEYFKGMS